MMDSGLARQVPWLKERIRELQEENKKLKAYNIRLENHIKELKNNKSK